MVSLECAGRTSSQQNGSCVTAVISGNRCFLSKQTHKERHEHVGQSGEGVVAGLREGGR